MVWAIEVLLLETISPLNINIMPPVKLANLSSLCSLRNKNMKIPASE